MSNERHIYGTTIDLGGETEVEINAQAAYAHSISIKITIAPAEFFLALCGSEDARRIGVALMEAANALDADLRKADVL